MGDAVVEVVFIPAPSVSPTPPVVTVTLGALTKDKDDSFGNGPKFAAFDAPESSTELPHPPPSPLPPGLDDQVVKDEGSVKLITPRRPRAETNTSS